MDERKERAGAKTESQALVGRQIEAVCDPARCLGLDSGKPSTDVEEPDAVDVEVGLAGHIARLDRQSRVGPYTISMPSVRAVVARHFQSNRLGDMVAPQGTTHRLTRAQCLSNLGRRRHHQQIQLRQLNASTRILPSNSITT